MLDVDEANADEVEDRALNSLADFKDVEGAIPPAAQKKRKGGKRTEKKMAVGG